MRGRGGWLITRRVSKGVGEQRLEITIVTVGSRGDVQPYVALGLGLEAAGHRVRLATHRPFAAFVRERGLEFAEIGGEPQQMLQTEAGRAWVESGHNPVRFVRRLAQLLEPVAMEMATQAETACRGSELILYSTFGMVAYYVGQKLGVPVIATPLQPLTRTRAFPNIAFPSELQLGGWFNWLTHVLGEQLFWQPIRPLVKGWSDRLGLAKTSFWGPFGRLNNSGPPLVYGFSPQVVPRPADWGSHIHIAGYWFLERREEWEPPADLLSFLADGPRPIYLGFGSMTLRNPEETALLVGRALALSGRRAVVLRGWGGLEVMASGTEVFVMEQVPHDWLFPKMAAVVHHGGAGTTAAGLRAGVPSVVVPFFADQNFWAGRVAALAVGPEPIPRRKLTAARLAGAIITATEDAGMAEQAASLGARIHAEDGVERAVAVIERLVAECCG